MLRYGGAAKAPMAIWGPSVTNPESASPPPPSIPIRRWESGAQRTRPPFRKRQGRAGGFCRQAPGHATRPRRSSTHRSRRRILASPPYGYVLWCNPVAAARPPDREDRLPPGWIGQGERCPPSAATGPQEPQERLPPETPVSAWNRTSRRCRGAQDRKRSGPRRAVAAKRAVARAGMGSEFRRGGGGLARPKTPARGWRSADYRGRRPAGSTPEG